MLDVLLLELGKFGIELWIEFKASAVPVLVPALVGVIVSGLATLKRKLDVTLLPVMVDVESKAQISARTGGVKTPGTLKFADVAATAKTELGKTWVGKAALAMGVQHSIESLKPVTDALADVVTKHSVLPLGPGASGEHVILIPKNLDLPADFAKDAATLDDGEQ